MRKKSVIVTGAGGLVGSQVCDVLLEKGLIVYGTYRKNRKIRYQLKKNANFKAIHQDIVDFETLNRSIAKIRPDAVFHTAAFISGEETSPLPFFENNVTGTFHLLEACRRNKVSTFIHSSSMSVYGTKIDYLPVDEKHPLNPYDFYGASKKMADDLCSFYAEHHNMNVVILRYSGIFGPGKTDGAVASFVANALLGKPLSVHTDIGWDILSVYDIARANFLAYENAKKIKFAVINVGRGKDIHIVDLAKKILVLTGSKSVIDVKVSPKDSPYRFRFDTKKAKKLLRFKPESLDVGLKKFIDSMKQ